MNITTPMLVEERRPPKSRAEFRVRPLFFPDLVESGADLSVVTSKAVQTLRKYLESEARSGNHEVVARFSFAPDVHLQRHKMQIELSHRHVNGAFPLAVFRALGRRMGFMPTLPEVWFEIQRGADASMRFQHCLTLFLRKLEREEDEAYVLQLMEPYTAKYQAWVTTVDYNISANQVIPKASEQESLFAALGGNRTFNGAEELRAVGRCLDWQFPTGLMRTYRRDDLVERFVRLMNAPERRPILLLGPEGVGKTTLVNEFVYRHNKEKGGQFQSRRNTWLVSPQRLISGMSYVGQWEARLLAIVKKMHKHEDWLYLDDLNGMFRAGVSSSSDLSVADLLKRAASRRELKIVAETTPAQWRVFRETDRGFADLFQILRVEEPPAACSQLILLDTIRQLEQEHACLFNPKTLPLVVDLTRRYMGDTSMPGKAVNLLSQLAINRQKRQVAPLHALQMIQQTSGMKLNMLDPGARLPREQIVAQFERRIIGQPDAVAVLADVMSISKARLNDPSRPLATLLFLGPTGVGKTETAKALADVFFGSESRLLRFDMNEYVAPGSASRLTGGGGQPEGLLTSAIRRQPFSVVLLDEIEKAHPDVFDTLLQVLGEGRLTDSLGRTAYFGNAVIIMTSNLGVRQAASRIGFDKNGAKAQQPVYAKAAEDFFRPEFFNRLDHVVPFAPLDRDSLAKIARMLMADVLSREGLSQRRTSLAVSDSAVQWVIDRGYHPTLGARAMRRAIEKELVQPVARQLAAVAPGTPFVLQVTQRKEHLKASVIHLEEVKPGENCFRPGPDADSQRILKAAGAAIGRLTEQFQQYRPEGELTPGAITDQQWQFLAAMQFVDHVRNWRRRLLDDLESRGKSHRPPAITTRPPRSKFGRYDPLLPSVGDLFAADDINQYLNDLTADATARNSVGKFEESLLHLLDALALLEAISPTEPGMNHQRCLLLVRTASQAEASQHAALSQRLANAFRYTYLLDEGNVERFGPTGVFLTTVPKENQPASADWYKPSEDAAFQRACARLQTHVIEMEGVAAHQLCSQEVGTHLCRHDAGHFVPYQVIALPLEADDDAVAKLLTFEEECRQREQQCMETGLEAADDPLRFRPLLRIYDAGPSPVVDLRSGVVSTSSKSQRLRRPAFAALPLPQEIVEAANSSDPA